MRRPTGTRGTARSGTIAVGAAATLALGGCSSLALRTDASLRFLQPRDHAQVAYPLRIRWRIDPQRFRATGFDGTRDPRRGAFLVVVDRPPMAPGSDIDSLARSDRICHVTPHCPDKAWLERHGVYVTTRKQLDLAALPAQGVRAAGALRRHEITIVLVNGRGVRVGESAWTLVVYAGRRNRDAA
jgi:hypothetical protein